MDFIEVIKKRRSVRNFSSKSVSDEIIRELLEAARLAPSGGNGQNWVFGIVKEDITKRQLSIAAGNQNWIATAPIIIACCARLEEDMSSLPKDDFGLVVNKTRFGEEFISYMNAYTDRNIANTFWSNSVPLIPGEHIFLTAINYGLSSCWVGYLDIRKASEILNLPKDYVCLFLMPIGYANEEPGEIYRKPYEEIVFYDRFDDANIVSDLKKV